MRDGHDVDFELGDVEEGVCACAADAVEEFEADADGGLEGEE